MRPLREYTDEELIAGLNNGDKVAFEAIYRKYVSGLYRYARKNIAAREECEEIIQDVFESLWRRRAVVTVNTSLQAYMIGMVRYKIIHHFRKSALRKKYADHFLLFEAVYAQAEEAEIDHDTIQAGLDKLINELPKRCQEALRLRLSEELSNRDIARRMNITTRTVEGYMFRAYNHIRTFYKLHLNE